MQRRDPGKSLRSAEIDPCRSLCSCLDLGTCTVGLRTTEVLVGHSAGCSWLELALCFSITLNLSDYCVDAVCAGNILPAERSRGRLGPGAREVSGARERPPHAAALLPAVEEKQVGATATTSSFQFQVEKLTTVHVFSSVLLSEQKRAAFEAPTAATLTLIEQLLV